MAERHEAEREQPAERGEPEIYDLEPEETAERPEPRPEPARGEEPVADPVERVEAPRSTAMAKRPDAPFTRGLGGIRATMTAAGVVVLLALIVSGVRGGDTRLAPLMLTLGAALLTMFVHAALGTLAVIAAARCVGTRVAEPELFALRMLTAAAAFVLLVETGVPSPWWFDDWLLGVAGYATVVWLLFRLPARETGLVMLWHGGLIGLLWLQGWMTREADREPTPPVTPAETLPGSLPVG